MDSGKFKLKQVTKLQDIINGTVKELPESDLCFQSADSVIQFSYEENDDENQKYEVKPGFYRFENSNAGLTLAKMSFRRRELLEEVTSTKSILNEARTFFKRLHVYEQLNRPKKRGVLLYSAPGCGKSSSIEKFCSEFAAEDPGTVVLVWPTSNVDADAVMHFFTTRAAYMQECTRVIIVMEDIGGGEPGEARGSLDVDSGLLNLLDGVGLTFKLPTFIVATTNHPEALLQSLADRPGRFDLMLKLNPPTHEEKKKLLAFISKRELNDEEKECVGWRGTEDFSVAHLEEVAVRSLLHDKTYPEVVREMIEHSKRFKKGFEERDAVGFGR